MTDHDKRVGEILGQHSKVLHKTNEDPCPMCDLLAAYDAMKARYELLSSEYEAEKELRENSDRALMRMRAERNKARKIAKLLRHKGIPTALAGNDVSDTLDAADEEDWM